MIDLGTIPMNERVPTYLFADHITAPASDEQDGSIRLFVIRTEVPRLIVEIERDEQGGLEGSVVAQMDSITKTAAKIILKEIAQFAAEQINERSED